MKYQFPKRIQDMTPYQPITGDYQIRMDANESYLNLSDTQWQRIQARLAEVAYNRYPDPYTVALGEKFASFYGVDPQFVVAGNGSDEIISLLFGTFFDEGDTVAVFQNDFSMYGVYCETYGVSCKALPKEDNLTINVEKTLQRMKEENITGIIFSNPCNPTSLGLGKEDVRKLIRGTDALVILDEAYMDFWGESLLNEIGEYENLIILKTCSKALGMAGIRLGFLVANPKIADMVRAVKSPYNVNSLTQVVGEELFSEPEKIRTATAEIVENKNRLEQAVKSLAVDYPNIFTKVYDSCTNFVFIKTPYGKEIFQELLHRSIAVRFMGDYLRISTGSKDENSFLIRELQDILQGLIK